MIIDAHTFELQIGKPGGLFILGEKYCEVPLFDLSQCVDTLISGKNLDPDINTPIIIAMYYTNYLNEIQLELQFQITENL